MHCSGGFLPDVELNRQYARKQLEQLKARQPQPDFWLRRKDGAGGSLEETAEVAANGLDWDDSGCPVCPLARRLLGMTDSPTPFKHRSSE